MLTISLSPYFILEFLNIINVAIINKQKTSLNVRPVKIVYYVQLCTSPPKTMGIEEKRVFRVIYV